MYKNILVPVLLDPEVKPTVALELAQALSAPGAKITLLHVMEEIPGYAKSYLTQTQLENGRKEVVDELNAMAKGVTGGEGVLVEGHSSRTILEYSKKDGTDCIIISSHRPGIQDYFLGGTAARVVRFAQCSVHVVR